MKDIPKIRKEDYRHNHSTNEVKQTAPTFGNEKRVVITQKVDLFPL